MSSNKTTLEQAFVKMYDLHKLAITSSPSPVTMNMDQFKTIWTGFEDARALAFDKTIKDEATNGLRAKFNEIRSSEGGLDFINRVSDEYTRLRHAEDHSANTGQRIAEGVWTEATRGEKLRYFAKPLRPFGDHHQRVRFVLQELGTAAIQGENDEGELSQAAAKCNNLSMKMGSAIAMLEMLKNDIEVLGVLKGLFRELEKLVRDEIKNGWDWQDGLSKQFQLRMTIDEGWAKLSKYFWTVALDELENQGASTELKAIVGEKIGGN